MWYAVVAAEEPTLPSGEMLDSCSALLLWYAVTTADEKSIFR